MQEFVINIMNQYGNVGIAILIAIENIFPPIPSELILTFGGFMTTYSNLTVMGVIVSSTIGSLIGAVILYGIGRILNKDILIILCNNKVGKVLHFKAKNIEKSQEWFANKSKYAVLFCRCVPIIRSLISIPAGMSKMNFGEFIILTTIGTIIWNTVITMLGRIAGNSWKLITVKISQYAHFIYLGIGILIIIIILKKIINKKR